MPDQELPDPEPILDRLNGLYWLGHEGQAGISPVQIARSQPTAEAVATLRANYDEVTARAAIAALIDERSDNGNAGILPSGLLSANGISNTSVFGLGLLIGAGGMRLWMRRSRSSKR